MRRISWIESAMHLGENQKQVFVSTQAKCNVTNFEWPKNPHQRLHVKNSSAILAEVSFARLLKIYKPALTSSREEF